MARYGKAEGRRMVKVLATSLGVAGLAALLLTAILLLGPPASGPPRDADRAAEGEAPGRDDPRLLSEEEALREDARWYARDTGISLDEAVRRLRMQDDTLPTDLERELKASEKDAFAGLWLRHKPTYGITVATAGDPEAMRRKIEPFVAGTRWEGTVKIKHVGATEAELNAARARAEGMMDRLGIAYESGDNIMQNRMEIYVGNKTRVERRLDAAGLELPAHVVLLEGMSVPMAGSG